MPNTLLPIPHRLQRSDGDCLAACAAMALDSCGVPSDYDRLLKLLGVKPYGAPGSRLNNLTDLGVQVRYAQGSLDELIDYLSSGQPCIVLVHTGHLPIGLVPPTTRCSSSVLTSKPCMLTIPPSNKPRSASPAPISNSPG